MSLVTGQVVYASLAQLSVKGAMDAKLSQLSIGQLDVFSSAFWTHPAFAHSVIRNCDEELTFTEGASGVRIFQPPRSMDIVYNMFAVVDLPESSTLPRTTAAGTKSYPTKAWCASTGPPST